MRNIGKNIQAIRTAKKMTQDELAEQLFVTRQTVSNYETGRSRPDVDTLVRIAQIFQVDLQELIYEPTSAAERRKKILLVCIVSGLMLILGIGVHLLAQYAYDIAMTTYVLLPRVLVGYLVQPGYFIALGWAVTACVRMLTGSRPLNTHAVRALQIAVCVYVVFYLLCQLPWMLGDVRFPRFWFSLSVWAGRYWSPRAWLFLFPGAALGLCMNRKQHTTE